MNFPLYRLQKIKQQKSCILYSNAKFRGPGVQDGHFRFNLTFSKNFGPKSKMCIIIYFWNIKRYLVAVVVEMFYIRNTCLVICGKTKSVEKQLATQVLLHKRAPRSLTPYSALTSILFLKRFKDSEQFTKCAHSSTAICNYVMYHIIIEWITSNIFTRSEQGCIIVFEKNFDFIRRL